MITTKIFELIFTPIFALLDMVVPYNLPAIPQEYFTTVVGIIKILRGCIHLPSIATMFAISFGISNLKLFWTIFLRIKSFIPFWGN